VLEERYKNLPGVEYMDPDGVTFVKQDDRGVLPLILDELTALKKKAKLNMKRAGDAGDKEMQAIYDGQQIAIKVTSNSMYGLLG